MNRRKLFAWLGGWIAFATAGGLAIAKVAPASSSENACYCNEGNCFTHDHLHYELHSYQEFDGTKFETWKTPNGYVHINTVPKMDLHEKYDVIVWYDEHFLPHGKAPGVFKSMDAYLRP